MTSAAYGLSIAFRLAQRFPIAASPSQLIGAAKLKGFDPMAEGWWLFFLLCGAVGGSLFGRFVLARLAERLAASPSAANAAWVGLWLSPIVVSAGSGVLSVALAGLAGFVFLAVFSPAIREGIGQRRLGLPCAIAQAILVWTFLESAGLGWKPRPVSLAVVSAALAIAEGIWAGGGSLESAAGAFAPSALLAPLAFWRARPAGVSLAAAVIAVVLPPVTAAVIRHRFRAAGALRAAARYLLLPACFVALAAAAFLRHVPRADLFEDGHSLLPASEYLRGELPYRDIVPGHGLLSDGLLQTLELRIFGADYRGISRGDRIAKAVFWPAFFALGYAATGSPAVGFAVLLLTFLSSFPDYGFFRLLGSLIVLIPVAFAQRNKDPRAWAAVGACVPLGLLIAVEFGAYAAAAAALSLLFVARGRRSANFAFFCAGGVIVTAAVAVVFAAAGILGSFVRATFRDTRGLLARYSLGMSPLPASFHGLRIPDLAAAVSDNAAVYFWVLLLGTLLFAVILARSPAVGARARAVFPLLAWFLLATLSVVERRHENYALFLYPAILVLTACWIGAGSPVRRALALVVLALAVGLSRPIAAVETCAALIASDPVAAGDVIVDHPRRARGAVFDAEGAAEIAEVEAFLNSGELAPEETWLDFSNHGIFYFLFDRDCPIRYYEVAFFQTPSAQREVIQAIDSNRRVRAVLVGVADIKSSIDGISNRDRAPLVWAYVESHFHPAFRGKLVEFWIRNP